MFVSLLFWLALLLPGYALARCVCPGDFTDSGDVPGERPACGMLGVVALSFFWAFALLSPASMLCYVLHLPVFVFSAACVAAIVAGVVVIHRRRWWRPMGRLMVAGVGIELLLVVIDLVFAARTGAFFSGDAEMHLARIRYLLDHGFSNRGPYYDVDSFFWLYHTNLLHALFAACSQLTGTGYLSVWFTSQVFAKLVIAGGVYYFAWQALRSRWAAWLPALFLLANSAPVTYLMYPNKLAPMWLLPIALGVCIAAVREGPLWAHVCTLAAASLVLGQVHSLYAFFMGLVIGPILGVWLAARLIRRSGGSRVLCGCLAALFAGAPFMLYARYGGERPPRDPDAPVARTPDEEELRDKFHELDNDRIVLKFGEFLGDHTALRLVLFAAGAVGLALLGRRRESAVLVALVAINMVVLFVPAICTALRDLMGARWILLRIGSIAGVAVIVGFLGAVGLAVERFVPRPHPLRVGQMFVSLAVAALGLMLIWSRGEYSWKEYLAHVRAPAVKRYEWLNYLRYQRTFLREHVAPGSIVLAHPRDGRTLVMLHDCYVVSVDRSASVNLTGPQRQDDLALIYWERTSWEERKALLEKYHIDRVLRTMRSNHLLGWVDGHIRGEIRSDDPAYSIIVLDME